MRNYELTVIFRPEDEQFKPALENVKTIIADAKAKIEKENDWGVKELAYPINKNLSGHYIMFDIQAEQGSVEKMDTDLKLAAGVLKFLFVRKKN